MDSISNASMGYVGKVKVKKLSSKKSSYVTLAEKEINLTNKGTSTLFRSLVGYLVGGASAESKIPFYLRIMSEDSRESYINHALLLTKRVVQEEQYFALCSCSLNYSNLIADNLGKKAKLQLITEDSTINLDPNIILAETTYQLPSGDNFTQNQALLIEWRLGFVNLENSSEGGNL